MKQLSLPSSLTGEKQLTVTGRDHHYLSRVLRVKPGDVLPACDAAGDRFRLTVVAIRNKSLMLDVEPAEADSRPPYRIALYQCLPKGKLMDRIIRQATEAGVAQIHPLISERTLGWENRADRLEGKTNRWKRIARSAVEQSGVRQPPIIESPRHLKDIQVDGSACNILFHPVPISNSSLHGLLELGPEKINLLLGPEGGFSEKELHRLLAIGYHPVYLGDSVLRVDTAALFAIAGVRLIILELEGWKKR